MSYEIHYGRKRRSIIKALNSKIEEWLKSLPPELAKKAGKDLIVTGGAICSMFMGDKVKDYDFYFRTLETTEALARHYVTKFNEANQLKVTEGVIPYAPEVRIEDVTNIKGNVERRVMLYMKSAGVAGEEQAEYAYFEQYPDGDRAEEFAESLAHDMNDDQGEPYRPVFLSQNAITLSHGVQLVTRFYGEPNQIHENYDFVHAKCYFDYHSSDLVAPAEALEAMLSRTLVYRGSLYPVASIFRVKKFLERGWRISAGQLLKIMWQISEIDMKNRDVMREQLTGVDQAYMYQLIDALKDSDPERINSSYIATIIDRIFD